MPKTNPRTLRTTATLALLITVSARAAMTLHVAPTGDDANPGTKAAPLATLERARDLIRAARSDKGDALGPVTVILSEGTYHRTRSLGLSARDSGRPGAPVTYRAEPGKPVGLIGGRRITGFEKVTETAILKRLPAAARRRVVQTDIRDQGVTDLGAMTMRGFPQPIVPAPLELFIDGEPMTLARWPNDGFAKTGTIIDPGSKPRTGDKSNRPGTFVYDGHRPSRWSRADDVWLFGYWCWDWADETIRVAKIDPARHRITLAAPHHYGLKQGQRYYAMNLLEEIDEAGEWFLDRETGLLYLWPPTDLAQAEVMVSEPAEPFVVLRDVSHVRFEGLTFECARGTGIQLIGGTDNRIHGCAFRNLGNLAIMTGHGAAPDDVVGAIASSVFARSYRDTVWNRRAGTRHRIESCVLANLGEGGVILGGGDRLTLTPGRNAVVNCDFRNYSRSVTTNRPAVWIDGVGNRVAYCRIHDAPHTGIVYRGNDHVIAFNELHDLCKETGDVGAIYTGRDLTTRGTRIRYNYLHDINGPGRGGAQGIYLDDCASGTTSFGNVFDNVYRAFLIGGGRDNVTVNNMMIACNISVHLDARGIGWMKASAGEGGTLLTRLDAVPYREEPWRSRYPELAALKRTEAGRPVGNVVRRNLMLRCGGTTIHKVAREEGTIEGNFETTDDPGFVHATFGDYRLRPDAKLGDVLPGFEPIPVDLIGVQKPSRWEKAIRAFEIADAKDPPPKDPVLFVGSSSARMWNLKRHFPKLEAINRGFGGSRFADALYHADRIILPYEPRAIVIYDGDNDLAGGARPEDVAAHLAALVRTIDTAQPGTPIVVMAIKFSRSRWNLQPAMARANELMKAYAAGEEHVTFVDGNTPLLGPDGKPREDMFLKDNLHLSDKGYRVWSDLVRPMLERR